MFPRVKQINQEIWNSRHKRKRTPDPIKYYFFLLVRPFNNLSWSSVQTGCEMLPIDFEALVVKIYKFFHIYTVRTEALKKFCLEAAEKYMPLVKHSGIFLSLLPAMNRIIDLYEPTEKVPKTITSFFFKSSGKIYQLFIKYW